MELMSKKVFTLYWNLNPKNAQAPPVSGAFPVSLPEDRASTVSNGHL